MGLEIVTQAQKRSSNQPSQMLAHEIWINGFPRTRFHQPTFYMNFIISVSIKSGEYWIYYGHVYKKKSSNIRERAVPRRRDEDGNHYFTLKLESAS